MSGGPKALAQNMAANESPQFPGSQFLPPGPLRMIHEMLLGGKREEEPMQEPDPGVAPQQPMGDQPPSYLSAFRQKPGYFGGGMQPPERDSLGRGLLSRGNWR